MDYSQEVAYGKRATGDYESSEDYQLRPLEDAISYFREYARERPEVAALTCFCIGFVLGWKLKPW